jgi:hypothetical protein
MDFNALQQGLLGEASKAGDVASHGKSAFTDIVHGDIKGFGNGKKMRVEQIRSSSLVTSPSIRTIPSILVTLHLPSCYIKSLVRWCPEFEILGMTGRMLRILSRN